MFSYFHVNKKTCKGDNMAKRPSLAANVKAAAGEPPVLPVAQMVQASPPTDTQPEAKRSASRAGRKAIYAWVDPAEHRKLKRLSLDTDRSIDALVAEGVHLLFEKHGVE
jgi:hypothetical protein